MTPRYNPAENMASARHEFGEHGGVNMSIETSTTFTVMEANIMPDIFQGVCTPDEGGCYLYGRHFNPTVYVLGHQLAAMENTESAYCTASGISAIASTIMQLCRHGDHVVAGRALYGGTFALFKDFLPARTNIETTFVDPTDLKAVEQAFTDKTRVLYVESMANPTLDIADLPRLAEIAHRHNAKLVVDNTFTPMVITPSLHGADIVVHSLTKFISGGSDIIGGVICGSKDFIMQLMDVNHGALMLIGPTMDPNVAFKLSLRLPHMGVRMAEHSRRAREFASRLTHLGVSIRHPGLDAHPQNALLRSLANDGYGLGGLITINLDTIEQANHLMETLQNEERFGYMAVSLGYFDTLMSASAVSTSSELGEDALAEAGIPLGLVRMSVGITGSLEQRWAQLERGLRKAGLVQQATGPA